MSFSQCAILRIMIMQLRGRLAHKEINFAVLDVQGVGYKVRTLADTVSGKHPGDEVLFWTHLAVREDALELYGFGDRDELSFFELLIAISGIGPKSALAIMNLASVPELKKAIAAGDTHYLTKVSGIGKKNAAKIVLELKDIFIKTGHAGNAHSLKEETDALLALTSLGYTREEARNALGKITGAETTTGEKVKEALKILSR